MLRTNSTNRGPSPKANAASLGGGSESQDRRRSICLVAPAGVNVDRAVEERLAAGWQTHVLWCGPKPSSHTSAAHHGCSTWRLDEFSIPAQTTLDGPHATQGLHESDRIRHALQRLHALQRFTHIEFPLRGGLGFRTFQAQQTGQAFCDVALSVSGDVPTSSARHEQGEWPERPEELTLDYMERYTLHPPKQPTAANTNNAQPLVSVCIPYFNLGAHLEATLASLAKQTYANLEVLVIDDGSTDAHAVEVFGRMQAVYPQFRFLEQANAGIGATRNRGLQLAAGEYFLPVDADNIAAPDMVRRLVEGMQHNADIAALTCYFLAFRNDGDLHRRQFAYAYKPVGGPRVLGCLQNIYGDGNAMFRTEALRLVGGFATDRDTSFEDWEAFVKLTNAGYRVEVLPDFLFYYRHRDAGFSRATSAFRNRQRVLRRFIENESWPQEDRQLLWNWLVGGQLRQAELEAENRASRAQPATAIRRMAKRITGAFRRLARTESIVRP